MSFTPLTVAEARAILLADEALHLSYEARLTSGNTFDSEEIEAWANLVASAEKRVEAYYGNCRDWRRCPACGVFPHPRGPVACSDCRALNQNASRKKVED
jgi:hypothetical protein